MSTYEEFFLNSNANVVELELIEISHPDMTQVYRLVRNAMNGITVTLEDGSSHTFDYYPLRITPNGASDDLDQTLTVDWGDLGEVLPEELDAIATANTFGTKPVFKYRTYRSDDLTQPLHGPFTFEVSRVNFNKDGASMEIRAPRLNNSSTGERYNLDRFTMLRGFF